MGAFRGATGRELVPQTAGATSAFLFRDLILDGNSTWSAGVLLYIGEIDSIKRCGRKPSAVCTRCHELTGFKSPRVLHKTFVLYSWIGFCFAALFSRGAAAREKQ